MEKKITINPVTRGFANTSWVGLEATPTTALIFQPEIHEGGVRGRLIRFKKVKGSSWEEVREVDFRKLKLNEGVKIELSTDAVARLMDAINKRNSIIKEGIRHGKREFAVVDPETVLIVDDTSKRTVIEQLLSQDLSDEFWSMLQDAYPEVATRLSLGHIQAERQQSLDEFRESLITKGTGEEGYWQDFFERNKWIFGYGLNYQILREEQAQPNYGGTQVDGTGGERGDYLMTTEGDIGFTVLVEIKTPATPLLRGSQPQRNGAWGISHNLVDGVTQLQANCARWEIEGSRTDENKDRLEGNRVFTTVPNGILLIGSLSELSENRDKRNTIQRFRAAQHGIEILTFDELLKRAEFIVGAS